MKNEIQVMKISEILPIAELFAQSGMFSDAKGAAQAFVKIQAGQEIGLSPFASMSGISIIMGKLTFGASIVASKVKGSQKYDFKVKELTDLVCSIDFFEGKNLLGNSTFTIEDAKKQATKNLDKFPRNMLYARAISNGQKWFCPDVFEMAVYVPEEMNQESQILDISHQDMTETAKEIPVIDEKVVKKIPTLTAGMFNKLMAYEVDQIESFKNNLIAIDEGLLIATSEQTLLLTERYDALEKQVNGN